MEEIFKGGTLIINLDSIKMVGSDYIFKQDDKILIALKKINNYDKNVLYGEITPTPGETKASHTFSHIETEKLIIGATYELQADLITDGGKPFPMLLQKMKVVGRAIIPEKVGD